MRSWRRRASGSSAIRPAFIAQPVIQLSVHPTLAGSGCDGKPALAARHVDLRPFVLLGAKGRGCWPAGSRASRCAKAR